MTYKGSQNPALQEFAVFFDGGDPWGSAISFLFGICYVLYTAEEEIPDAWEFSPGLMFFDGIEELAAADEFPDNFLAEGFIVGHWNGDQLRYAGNVLSRYMGFCKRAGHDY